MRFGFILVWIGSLIHITSPSFCKGQPSFDSLYSQSQFTTQYTLAERLDYARQALLVAKKSLDFSLKLDAFINLGALSLQAGKPDQALHCFWQAQKLCVLNNLPSSLAAVKNNLGAIHYYEATYPDSASAYYEQALTLYQEQGDSINQARCTQNLAILSYEIGNYAYSLSASLEALELFEKLNLQQESSSCLNNAGLVMMALKEYPQSLTYFRQALRNWRTISDSLHVGVALNNLGWVKLKLQESDSAIWFLNQAAEWNKAAGYGNHYYITLDFLSQAYALQNVLDSAFFFQHLVLKKRHHLQDSAGIASCYERLGRFFLQAGTLDSARWYADRGSELASELKSFVHQLPATQLLLDLELRKTKPTEASHFVSQILTLRDSLFSQKIADAVESAHIRYQTRQKEQALRVATLTSELKTSQIKTRNKALISLGVVLLILVIGTGAIYRLAITRKQANIALSKANNRIELLLKDQNHRVKNELQKVGDIIALSQLHVENNDAKSILQEHLNRIHALNLVHRKLFQGTDKDSIRLPDFLQELVDQLVFSYGLRQIVRPNLQIMDIEMPTQQAMTLALILNEWVSNSLKYATRQERPGLGVSLASEGENYQLSVRDNGPGLNNTSKGFGLQLVDKQAILLNGSVSYTYDDGLLQTLVFPKTLLPS